MENCMIDPPDDDPFDQRDRDEDEARERDDALVAEAQIEHEAEEMHATLWAGELDQAADRMPPATEIAANRLERIA